MRKSRIAVLALAVAAAGGAFVLANAPKPPQPVSAAAPAPPPPTDDVLVAAKDMPVGTVVGEPELAWQSWPKTGVTSAMIVKANTPNAVQDIKGSIARASLFQGEPIHREKLIKGTNGGFMSAVLPPGMRAVAVNIDTQGATTAGGFILPGDRIDVVRTFHDDSTTGQNNSTFTSETILRNVKVLAIGPNVENKNGQPVVTGSNATLELDPVQAETVILAQRVGQLSLVLRSLEDANRESEAAPKSDRGVTVVRYGVQTETGAH